MNTGVISVRYARALLKSADSTVEKDAVYADMQRLAQNYIDVRQLRTAIDNPMLPKQKKEEILLTACGGNPSMKCSTIRAMSFFTLPHIVWI